MKRLQVVLSLILFSSCSSEYKKGETAFEKRNYEEAKNHYNSIGTSDKYYADAQRRLGEISLVEKEELFSKAVLLYNEGRYNEARLQFYLLSEADEQYKESRKFVIKIDSVNELKEIAYLKRKKVWDIENEKKAITKENKKSSASKEEDEIRTLLNSLIDFKDKTDFHKHGFSVVHKYHKWMDRVIRLKSVPEANLSYRGFVMGDLETLGFEYLNSKGKETEYSLFMKKTIITGLSKSD